MWTQKSVLGEFKIILGLLALVNSTVDDMMPLLQFTMAVKNNHIAIY